MAFTSPNHSLPLIDLLPFLCDEVGTQNSCWKNLVWVWAHRVYRAMGLNKCTKKNARLEELSKLTWSLEVFEIGPLSFAFSACKPRHTALNVRTQLPSSPGMAISKSAGEPGQAAGIFTGLLETTIPVGPVLQHQHNACWDEHAQALVLERIWTFEKKNQCSFLFFSMQYWKAWSLWHPGDVVTRSAPYLLFS